MCAVLFRNYDPIPPTKRYTWESEDEEDILIGDAWDKTGNDIDKNEKPK
jgi:hypothetical protein